MIAPEELKTREQDIVLKDGRIIFKTSNGFRYWVESRKGEITEVSEDYFNKAKINRK